jgi:cobalt-zinc-cadmium efflux system membrane fusion protein
MLRAGIVASVNVKEGQSVKPDDPLVALDDTVDKAAIKKLEAQADDDTHVLAAQANLDQSNVDLTRTQQAFDAGAVTPNELDKARLAVTIAELSLRLQKFEASLSKMELAAAKARLDQSSCKSVVKGIVEVVGVEVGDPVEELKPIIRIVNIDPLWIDAKAPIDIAAQIRPGQKFKVLSQSTGADFGTATVLNVSAVADATARTLRVRLELPNPDLRPAGQHVLVKFDSVSPSGPSQPDLPADDTTAHTENQP